MLTNVDFIKKFSDSIKRGKTSKKHRKTIKEENLTKPYIEEKNQNNARARG